MEPLNPLVALSGGVLIGLAAALLLLMSGRIAGVSGLTARALGIASSGPGRGEAAMFVAGLPLGAVAVNMFLRQPDVIVTSSVAILIAAGLLVGFGTRLGSGCTSGHGVCGMSRLSPRSFAATAAFMTAGVIVVGMARYMVGG
ncbi:YeeE/YedE family protein [Altererythrobacter aquiaggeris]|uniref:YeeE/YedE family protein n=1 Tax=Aestuarierythrobacter aquiaggeris TaxID=1898396 RepID=UPI00301834F7